MKSEKKAPPSLAGGEVWAALEPFAKVADTALCPSDEPDDNDFIRLDETIAITVADIRRAASVFAALSPEAPAREGVDVLVQNAVAASMAEDQQWTELSAPARAVLMIQICRRVTAALTPRHEAPAERAGESFWFDALDPEVTDKNPDNILSTNYVMWDVAMIQCGDMAMFGFWYEPSDGSEFQYRYFSDRDQADAEVLAHQAARSSAPEARDAAD